MMRLEWGKPGYGRWYKRRLSKARRRAFKREVKGLHVRKALITLESDVNWKGT